MDALAWLLPHGMAFAAHEVNPGEVVAQDAEWSLLVTIFGAVSHW
jgi:hypothetical protein